MWSSKFPTSDLLIIFASGLIGCMLVFAAEASISKAVLIGVLASSLTLALLTVRMLDFHSRALCSSLHTTSTRHLRKPIIRLRPLSRMAQRASE
jgi:hypothetical protein